MESDPQPDPQKSGPESQPDRSGLSDFWQELKRRKVMQVVGIYAGVGWVVMQVGDTMAPYLGIPDWVMSALIILIILGFPVAMVVAWIYDLTPEGIRTTDTLDEKTGEAATTSRPAAQHSLPLLLTATAVPTVIFGVLAIVFFFKARSASSELVMITSTLTESDKSIAVLPFKNRSNLEEDLFFTDGIHDDLLSHISRIGEIKTISRTSVEVYRDTIKNMKTIGEELGVRTILEGGVQRAGNQVQINVQLIDTVMDSLMWSEIFVRELTAENVFEIQNEISRVVAQALQTVLSPADQKQLEQPPTTNLAALEAYFRGKERLKQASAVDLVEAVKQFTEAITLDPDFALAHAFLGEAYVMQANWKVGSLPVKQQIAKAEPHINRALELDDQLSEAYVALGKLRYVAGNQGTDPKAPEEAYRKAIELNPNNAEAYKAFVSFARRRIRSSEEVLPLLEKYLELDPTSEDAEILRAAKLQESGQLEEAEQKWLSIIAKNPDDFYSLSELAELYFWYTYEFDKAIVFHRKILAKDPENAGALNGIYKAYFQLGDLERAIWWGEQAAKLHQDPVRSARRKCWMLKLVGDAGDAEREKLALAILNQKPNDDELLMHINDIYLKTGRGQQARAFWVSAYPRFFEPDYQVQVGEVWLILDVIRVLQGCNELELANRLIEHSLKVTEKKVMNVLSQGLIQLACLFLMDGREEESIEYVRRFFEGGGTPSRAIFEDILKPLKNNPEYQSMVVTRQAELDVQLERLRELEANGELAPLPESLRR